MSNPIMSNLNSNLSSNVFSESSSAPSSPSRCKQKSATKRMKEEKKADFQFRAARIKELVSGVSIIYRQLALIEETNKSMGEAAGKRKWFFPLEGGRQYVLDKTAVKEYLEKINREVSLLERDANAWVTAKGSRTSANTKPIMYLESFINFLAGADLGPYVPVATLKDGKPDKKTFKTYPNLTNSEDRLRSHLVSLIPDARNPFYRFIAPSTVQSLISLAMHYDDRYRPTVYRAQGANASENRIVLSPEMRNQLRDVLTRSIEIDAEKVFIKLSDRANDAQRTVFRNAVEAAKANALENLRDIDSTRSTRVGDTDEFIFNPNYTPAFNKVKMLEGAKDEENKYSFLNQTELDSIAEQLNNARSEKERMDLAYVTFLNPENYNRYIELVNAMGDNDTTNVIRAYTERYAQEGGSLSDENALGLYLMRKMVSIALNNQTTLIKMASEYRTWLKDQLDKQASRASVARSKENAVDIIKSNQQY